MYLKQMGIFAKKIKRSINPTKRETCEQRVPQAIQMIEEVTVLKTQWSKAKSDDAKNKATMGVQKEILFWVQRG